MWRFRKIFQLFSRSEQYHYQNDDSDDNILLKPLQQWHLNDKTKDILELDANSLEKYHTPVLQNGRQFSASLNHECECSEEKTDGFDRRQDGGDPTDEEMSELPLRQTYTDHDIGEVVFAKNKNQTTGYDNDIGMMFRPKVDDETLNRVHHQPHPYACIQNVSAEHDPRDDTIILYMDLHVPPTEAGQGQEVDVPETQLPKESDDNRYSYKEQQRAYHENRLAAANHEQRKHLENQTQFGMSTSYLPHTCTSIQQLAVSKLAASTTTHTSSIQHLAVSKLSGTTTTHTTMLKRRRHGVVHHDPLNLNDDEDERRDIATVATSKLALLSNPRIRRSLDIFGHKPHLGEEVPMENATDTQIIDGHEQIPLQVIHRRDSSADDPHGLFHSSLKMERSKYVNPMPIERCPQIKKKKTRHVIKFTKDMVFRMEVQALLATTLAVCLWLPPAVTSVTFKVHMCACILLMTCSSILISVLCVY